jgi:hypothetical protein
MMETVADEPAVGNYFVSTYPPFSCWTEQPGFYLPEHRDLRYS